MSHIAFCIWPEPGHILPTVRIAKLLQERGRYVTYLSIPRFERFFRSYGLPCHPVLSEILPSANTDDLFGGVAENRSQHQLLSYYLDNHNDELAGRLIVGLRGLRLECLLCDTSIIDHFGETLFSGLSMPVIAVNTSLPNYFGVSKYNVPELVLCPSEIDFPHVYGPSTTDPNLPIYAEPSVLIQRKESPLTLKNLICDSPIVN